MHQFSSGIYKCKNYREKEGLLAEKLEWIPENLPGHFFIYLRFLFKVIILCTCFCCRYIFEINLNYTKIRNSQTPDFDPFKKSGSRSPALVIYLLRNLIVQIMNTCVQINKKRINGISLWHKHPRIKFYFWKELMNLFFRILEFIIFIYVYQLNSQYQIWVWFIFVYQIPLN